MIGDSVAKWDDYLASATYATRVRAQSGSKLSPFYLLYGREPLDFELGWAEVDKRSSSLNTPTLPKDDDHRGHLERIRTARQHHYNQLLRRAQALGAIDSRDITKEDSLIKYPVGTYVLLRKPKGAGKFQASMFGPYRVVKAHPLGTYALQTPEGSVLRNLVHGGRLMQAHVSEGTTPST